MSRAAAAVGWRCTCQTSRFPKRPVPTTGGQGRAWVVQRGDVVLLCARQPHAVLVVGQHDELVRASALGVL